jgi:hypothetical protein
MITYSFPCDVGTSSASTRSRKTWHLRSNLDSQTLASTKNILKMIENNKRKDHTRGDRMSTCDLGVNPSLEVTTIRYQLVCFLLYKESFVCPKEGL